MYELEWELLFSKRQRFLAPGSFLWANFCPIFYIITSTCTHAPAEYKVNDYFYTSPEEICDKCRNAIIVFGDFNSKVGHERPHCSQLCLHGNFISNVIVLLRSVTPGCSISLFPDRFTLQDWSIDERHSSNLLDVSRWRDSNIDLDHDQ